jgi:hypothetical protein
MEITVGRGGHAIVISHMSGDLQPLADRSGRQVVE